MHKGFQYRILVVDDEPAIRETSTAILSSKGYEIRSAVDGFDALVELRRSLPSIIISDLRMPHMSGFELLSVVRRRLPHIPVIAISGEYEGIAPGGLLADYFFGKGFYSPEELFLKIAELIEKSPLRPYPSKPDRSPVWIRKGSDDYFIVTCTECLRSYPVTNDEASSGVCAAECIFCATVNQFLVDPAAMEQHRSRPK